MKIYTATIKKDNCTAEYTIKAESKEEAIKRLKEITGEKVTVKEK